MEQEYIPNVFESKVIEMLCDIHEHLEIDKQDTTMLREAFGLHPWILSMYMKSDPPTTAEVAKETIEILVMWQKIEEIYDSLSDEGKSIFKGRT